MICTGSSNCWAEVGHQVRMPVEHRVDRAAQAVRVECAGYADVQLSRIQIGVAGRRGVGVKEQTLLHRGQRQDVGDAVLPLQLIDLLLAEPRGRDVRRRQPPPPACTCAQIPARTSNHS